MLELKFVKRITRNRTEVIKIPSLLQNYLVLDAIEIKNHKNIELRLQCASINLISIEPPFFKINGSNEIKVDDFKSQLRQEDLKLYISNKNAEDIAYDIIFKYVKDKGNILHVRTHEFDEEAIEKILEDHSKNIVSKIVFLVNTEEKAKLIIDTKYTCTGAKIFPKMPLEFIADDENKIEVNLMDKKLSKLNHIKEHLKFTICEESTGSKYNSNVKVGALVYGFVQK